MYKRIYRKRQSLLFLLQQKIGFWFATGGAGFCISRALALKMIPVAGWVPFYFFLLWLFFFFFFFSCRLFLALVPPAVKPSHFSSPFVPRRDRDAAPSCLTNTAGPCNDPFSSLCGVLFLRESILRGYLSVGNCALFFGWLFCSVWDVSSEPVCEKWWKNFITNV